MPSNQYKPQIWEKIVAFSAAGLVIFVILFLVIRNEVFADPNLVVLIRILTSFGVAVIAAVIPGFLNVDWSLKGLAIRAGGALAVFVMTLIVTPHVIQPTSHRTPPKDVNDFPEQERICKQDFKDSNLASDIVSACTKVIDAKTDDDDIEALIARAQAYTVQENYPAADSDFKKVFKHSNLKLKKPSDFTPKERQIAFLEAFWSEYKDLVKDNLGVCRSAFDVYKVPIKAYNDITANAANKEFEIKDYELFVLLELGHFLSDRNLAWNYALGYYQLILSKINKNSINALLSVVHAHLMATTVNPRATPDEDLSIVENYLTRIEQIQEQYPNPKEIQAKVLYHRGSLLARQRHYGDAVKIYDSILIKYPVELKRYPLLKFITERDKAFALFADGDKNGANTTFTGALVTLESINNMSDKERDKRKQQIVDFRESNARLETYIRHGSIFAQLLVHEFEKEKNAFIEKGHDRFYSCYQGKKETQTSLIDLATIHI